MSVMNAGARTVSGDHFPSKKALRAALAADPSEVVFYSTSPMGPHANESFRGNEVPADVTLSLVGPDPYTSRTWYGTGVHGGTGFTVK